MIQNKLAKRFIPILMSMTLILSVLFSTTGFALAPQDVASTYIETELTAEMCNYFEEQLPFIAPIIMGNLLQRGINTTELEMGSPLLDTNNPGSTLIPLLYEGEVVYIINISTSYKDNTVFTLTHGKLAADELNHSSYIEPYKVNYEEFIIEVQNNEGQRSGGDLAYYYDIGGKSLPDDVTPNYSQYNLTSSVQRGDIVFDAEGSFGITGHIALVEAVMVDLSRHITWVRVIEAISNPSGVCRGILDDTRVDERDSSVLRVSNVTAMQRADVIEFCIDQLGKKYKVDVQKNTSRTEPDWYCSEMIWAAYMIVDVDLEGPGQWFDDDPGITPYEIKKQQFDKRSRYLLDL